MPFNPTSTEGEYHYLAEIFVGASTFYFADEDLSIRVSNITGVFYEGRLSQSGVLTRNLGNIIDPKEIVNTFDLVMDNFDGVMGDRFNRLSFFNKQVRFYIGEGRVKANYSEVFRGNVVHPDGIQWDDSFASIVVADNREKDKRTLPLYDQIYDTDTYPYVEDKSSGKAIPILIGNWLESDGGGDIVPCACIDTIHKKFSIAGHNISSIDRFVLNAQRLNATTYISNLSLSDCSFFLTGIDYNATNDLVGVNCLGLYNSSGVIENPSDVLKELQIRFLGLTSDNMNLTAYAEYKVDTTDDKVRRYIDSPIGSDMIIGELLNESNCDLRFVDGKYSPKYRTLDITSTRLVIREVDLLTDAENKAAFSARYDPNRIYANAIRAPYKYSPVDAKYMNTHLANVSFAIASVGTVVERPWDFNWYYTKSTVTDRVRRELYMYGSEPLVVNIELGPRGMVSNPADQIDLVYDIFDSRTFQIRNIDLDIGRMTSRWELLEFERMGAGRWTADTASPWDTASNFERKVQGFWLSDTGYVSLSDLSSFEVSIWW